MLSFFRRWAKGMPSTPEEVPPELVVPLDHHRVATALRGFADTYEQAGYLREAHALRNAAVGFDEAEPPEDASADWMLSINFPHGGWEDPEHR